MPKRRLRSRFNSATERKSRVSQTPSTILSPPVYAATNDSSPPRLEGPGLIRKQQHVMDGLEVHIEVNDQRLEEFADEGQEELPGTTIKYVVAQPGENFTVAFSFDHEFAYKDFDLVCDLYLDGNYVDNHFLQREYGYVRRSHGFSTIRYSQGGTRFLRRMTFADLKINEEDEVLDAEQQEAIDALGEIQLAFWRINATFESAPQKEGNTSESDTSKKLEQVSEVSEKALKGRPVSHHVKLGEALAIGEVSKPRRPRPRLHFDIADQEPFATYVFRYRSTEALKIMGMIARTPEPVALEERPVEELTPEEMKELIRRQKEQLETAKAVKEENSDETAQPHMEPGYRSQWEDGDELSFIEVRPAKRARLSDGPINTVDLTDD